MTTSEAHDIQNFPALFSDERFNAVVAHLRSDVPSLGEQSGDWYRGYFTAIAKVMAMRHPPKEREKAPARPPGQYQARTNAEGKPVQYTTTAL